MNSKIAKQYANQVKNISYYHKKYNSDLEYLKFIEKHRNKDMNSIILKEVNESYKFRLKNLKVKLQLLQRGLTVINKEYKGNGKYEILSIPK
jgi:hypothetical protein